MLEIMRAEHIGEKCIDMVSANEAISGTIDVAMYQRKIERRNTIILLGAALLLTMGILLIGAMEWIRFVMVCLPVLSGVMGILLVVMGWYKRKRNQVYIPILISGFLGILFPVIMCVMFWIAFAFGAPVPA